MLVHIYLMVYNYNMNVVTKKRSKAVNQAVANQKLEGLKVSRESKKIASEYVSGKLSAKQAAHKIRTRYGSI